MATFYLLEGAFHKLHKGFELPKGAVKVPRLPKPHEQWNGTKFEPNPAYADVEVGPFHIDIAHIRKAVEASLVASGYNLSYGLLADEAKLHGIQIKDLAREVLAKDSEFRSRETKRRKVKKGKNNG